MEATKSKTVLYVRAPGLLTKAVLDARRDANARCPKVVTQGKLVRDACPLALAQGVKNGMPVAQARRLCPTLLAVPQEEVDATVSQRRFLDVLADLSPVVEPDGADAAYVDMTGSFVDMDQISAQVADISGMPPVVGFGVSRVAARAVAESHVERLKDAAVQWLWPNDPAVIGRMQRLGLSTFGAVAAVSEESLRLHFGKIAPLLHRRAHGVDLTPVHALYPPPCVDVSVDCSEAPIDDRERLRQVVARASKRAEYQLQGLGVGRHLILEVCSERGQIRQEWAVPVPVQNAAEIQRALWRMLGQTRLTAPVTRVHVRIEQVGVPSAHTADLFGVRADAVALEAVRRRLAARYGLTTLTILGQWTRTAREKRRAAVREAQRLQA